MVFYRKSAYGSLFVDRLNVFVVQKPLDILQLLGIHILVESLHNLAREARLLALFHYALNLALGREEAERLTLGVCNSAERGSEEER